jgi:RNA polymerase sigma factor (sigma-70 family)
MALNILRKRKVPFEPLGEEIGAADEDIPLMLDLRDAIEALDEGLYQIVIFRLRYGFSTAETARLTGITAGAVRQRLNRARKILRKSLANYHNEIIIRG